MNTDELMMRHSDEWYSGYLSKHHKRTEDGAVFDLDPRFVVFKDLLGEDRDQRISDIGCGTGDLLFFLQREGFQNVVGMDHSKVALEVAEKRGLDVIWASIEDLGKGQESPGISEIVSRGPYDVLILGEILEHLIVPERTLLSVRDLLVDDGTLLLSVPNAGWLWNGVLLTLFPQFLWLSTAFGSWTHIHQLTVYGLRAMLQSCGFAVQDVCGVRPHLDAWWKRRKWYGRILSLLSNFLIGASGLFANLAPSICSQQLVVRGKKMKSSAINRGYFRQRATLGIVSGLLERME